MLCIPLDADQPVVAKRAEDIGLGIRLDKDILTSEIIRSAAHTILSNESFYVKAKHYSEISCHFNGAENIKTEIIEIINKISE